MVLIDFLSNPWPWFISGPMIALVMFLLLWVGENFGVSSTLRTICSISGASKHSSYFDFDWKSQTWNIIFITGSVIGGFVASTYFQSPESLSISTNTINDLAELGINFNSDIVPTELFNWDSVSTLKGFLIMILGGFLVGFGARWAGGCTSGHAISGLSNLQTPSLIAVVGFFIGGLIMTFLIFPLIFLK